MGYIKTDRRVKLVCDDCGVEQSEPRKVSMKRFKADGWIKLDDGDEDDPESGTVLCKSCRPKGTPVYVNDRTGNNSTVAV